MKIGVFAKTLNRSRIHRRRSAPNGNQREVLDEAFTLLGDAIVIAHAKDRNIDFKACAAGKGLLDFEYYLQGLKKIGFTGPVIMHSLEEEDVAFSRDFLDRILAL